MQISRNIVNGPKLND